MTTRTPDRTREGNPIFERDAPIRQVVPHNSWCKDCVHLADACYQLKKAHVQFEGYTNILDCEGFEEVE